MSARPINPLCFDHLSFPERCELVERAALGKTDREIARMYYLDEWTQMDIAAELCMERSAVSRRLPRIRRIIEETT